MCASLDEVDASDIVAADRMCAWMNKDELPGKQAIYSTWREGFPDTPDKHSTKSPSEVSENISGNAGTPTNDQSLANSHEPKIDSNQTQK